MSHWLPSQLAVPTLVGPHEVQDAQQAVLRRVTPGYSQGIDRRNPVYMSTAEATGALSPFLRSNMAVADETQSIHGRAWRVLAGGDVLYQTRADPSHREPLPVPDRLSLLTRRQGQSLPPNLPQSRPATPPAQNFLGHHPKGAR